MAIFEIVIFAFFLLDFILPVLLQRIISDILKTNFYLCDFVYSNCYEFISVFQQNEFVMYALNRGQSTCLEAMPHVHMMIIKYAEFNDIKDKYSKRKN